MQKNPPRRPPKRLPKRLPRNLPKKAQKPPQRVNLANKYKFFNDVFNEKIELNISYSFYSINTICQLKRKLK